MGGSKMMGETRRRWRRIGLAGVVAGFALACGSGNEAAPGAAAPAASAKAPASALDPTDAGDLEALYVWDPTRGAARDLSRDTVACSSQVTAAGLPGVAEHIQCMLNLGWITQQPRG
jgi:hypothetical protein